MRIGIDAQFAAYEMRGVGRYITNLIRGLAQADAKNYYTIYGPRSAFPELHGRSNFQVCEAGNVPYPIWEQFLLPRWAQRDRLTLLHSPANTAPLRLSRRTQLLITVHDVMYLLPPPLLPRPSVWRQRLGNAYRRWVVPAAVSRADGLLAVSDFTKRQIVEMLHANSSNIRVIYEGIETPTIAPAQLPPGPFVLALGAPDPRKNTRRIIEAYAPLRRSGKIQEKLVIVGLRKWRSSPFWSLAQDLRVGEDVVFRDYVADPELAGYYSAARCLLYPSLYEGFGFPPLEAMALGTPVIASATASLPEIAGEAALFVNPLSTESIQEALLRMLQDEGLRMTLIAKGRAQAARFTWEKAVAGTLQLYRDLHEATTRR
jgi:glycosyltransferase involved in cell wall biosynthesis